MYSMDVQVMGLEELEKKLGTLAPMAKDVMKTALNETAKDARKELANKARNTYMVQYGAFNKSMKIRKARKSNPTATIYSVGKPIALRGFAYIPHNRESGEAAKAHQLRGNRNVPIGKKGYRMFYARMPQGHTGLFMRVPGSTMENKFKKNEKGKWERYKREQKKENKPREQIKEKFGSSIPVMLGGTRVYDEKKPEIEANLQNKLGNYVDQILRRM